MIKHFYGLYYSLEFVWVLFAQDCKVNVFCLFVCCICYIPRLWAWHNSAKLSYQVLVELHE